MEKLGPAMASDGHCFAFVSVYVCVCVCVCVRFCLVCAIWSSCDKCIDCQLSSERTNNINCWPFGYSSLRISSSLLRRIIIANAIRTHIRTKCLINNQTQNLTDLRRVISSTYSSSLPIVALLTVLTVDPLQLPYDGAHCLLPLPPTSAASCCQFSVMLLFFLWLLLLLLRIGFVSVSVTASNAFNYTWRWSSK